MDFAGRAKSKVELNVAPLIDIVFLLLIFFMLASTFVKPESIDLLIHGSDKSESNTEELLVVEVDANKSIRLNGLLMPLQQLESELKARTKHNEAHNITIQAKDDVSVQLLVQIMDIIKAAGLRNISLGDP